MIFNPTPSARPCLSIFSGVVGPAVYRQNRSGYEKRCTYLDAPEIVQPLSRVGRYIRHISPQLLPRSRSSCPPWGSLVIFWAHE